MDAIASRRPSTAISLRMIWALLAVAGVLLWYAIKQGGVVTAAQPAAFQSFASARELSVAVSEERLRFGANPTPDELLRAGLFAEPLVPVGVPSSEENRDLASALRAYDVDSREHGADAVESLTGFLATHPDTSWKPVLLVDLGSIWRKTGHFLKALDAWQQAWAMTKTLTNGHGRAVGDAAVASLSQLEA
ncbi:MAG: hypothetical protein ACRENE_31995, partial [Polyangiaceae bacterium]